MSTKNLVDQLAYEFTSALDTQLQDFIDVIEYSRNQLRLNPDTGLAEEQDKLFFREVFDRVNHPHIYNKMGVGYYIIVAQFHDIAGLAYYFSLPNLYKTATVANRTVLDSDFVDAVNKIGLREIALGTIAKLDSERLLDLINYINTFCLSEYTDFLKSFGISKEDDLGAMVGTPCNVDTEKNFNLLCYFLSSKEIQQSVYSRPLAEMFATSVVDGLRSTNGRNAEYKLKMWSLNNNVSVLNRTASITEGKTFSQDIVNTNHKRYLNIPCFVSMNVKDFVLYMLKYHNNDLDTIIGDWLGSFLVNKPIFIYMEDKEMLTPESMLNVLGLSDIEDFGSLVVNYSDIAYFVSQRLLGSSKAGLPINSDLDDIEDYE